PMIFGWQIVTDDAHLLLIGTVIAISILPITLMLQGPFGKNLRALATNEVGASAYGISASNYLIWAFMLSGAVTALAGGVSAPRQRIIDTDSFGLHYSILALAAPVLGGLTSVWGGMVGGSLMRILPEVLRPVSDYIDLIFAALVILTLRYAPGGITDTIARFFDRRGTPKELTAAARMKPPSKVNLTPLVVDVPFENERYPALEVDGVTKRYDALRAVDDASIIVPAGSLFGVIGPNGAGKTTLFNMISGFVTPDTGKIACFGTSIHPGRPEQRIEHGITRTFQNVAIFPTLSCFDNVLIGLGSNTPLNSIARSFDRALRNRRHMEEGLLVDQALAAVGLAAERDLRAGSLSLGDQRRLEIARAIVSRPRLLLLDEPVSGLSADEADALKPLLRGIVRQQGITIFVIEHDVGFLLDLCDSLAVMSSGKVIAQGAPKEVIAEPEVQRIYFGSITAVAHA
ncbi:MAG: branched-chain amino acid transport system ATP-binding protein livM, partial [Alphaproteobacteria bacterium]|nr:branched-chain amino acid transport system ATP-binding protein livM [Alphaproteobacteria bacterium]